MLSRYRRGDDGRTAEQRRTGRRWRKPVALFGEQIYFKPAGLKTPSNYDEQMLPGRYIGHHTRTGAVLVMTPRRACSEECGLIVDPKTSDGPRTTGTDSKVYRGTWYLELALGARQRSSQTRKVWACRSARHPSNRLLLRQLEPMNCTF